MKKYFLVSVILIGLGCVSKNKAPENLMTKQEMINFLIDLHIVEAKISLSRIPTDSVKLFFPEIEDELYQKHHINDSIYKKSYQYYLNNISQMEEIYSAVVDSLSLRERIMNRQ